MFGHVIQRLGHVLDAEIGDADGGNPIAIFHDPGQIHGRAGTLHHVEGRPVGAGQISNAAVAGDIGHDLHAHALKVFADHPDLARQIKIAEDIDGKRGNPGGVAGADDPGHGIAGCGVPGPLVALEAAIPDMGESQP
jgi:hypothetical protein